jgi:hypothetical protein
MAKSESIYRSNPHVGVVLQGSYANVYRDEIGKVMRAVVMAMGLLLKEGDA